MTAPVAVAEVRAQDLCALEGGGSAPAANASFTLNGVIEAPMFFHVITGTGGAGNVTDAQIDQQMAVLNARFASVGLYTFVHVGTSRSENNAWFNDFNLNTSGSTSYEGTAKAALAQDPAHVLNIYTAGNLGGPLGYARYPFDYDYDGGGPGSDPTSNDAESSYWHGVVMKHTVLPGRGEPNGDAGLWLVHEVGHYMGLFHTWGSSDRQCEPDDIGDFVDDTAPQRGPEQCGDPVQICQAGNPPDPRNHLNTPTYDTCMQLFTPGQVERMEYVTAEERPSLGGYPAPERVSAGVAVTLKAGTTFRYGPSGSLVVNGGGVLNASGVTFTAADPGQGWAGVRFLAGSTGSWTNFTTVRRVAGPNTSGLGPVIPTHAVTVTDTAPVFSDVIVTDPVPGTGPVDGFYVSWSTAAQGPGDAVVITRPQILGMTGRGVVGVGGARVEVVGLSPITGSGQSAVFAGGTTAHTPDVYIVPLPFAGPGGLRGPQITSNPGGGVAAASGAEVRFGTASETAPGNGYARVTGNGGRGLTATGGAVIYAGSGTVSSGTRRRNLIFNNWTASATGNGLATGTGSRVWARCNWWDSTVPANFRVGSASSGVFDASLYLTQDPYANANPPCTMYNDPMRGAGSTGAGGGAAWTTRGGMAARGDSASALDRLDAAVTAASAAEAVEILAALMADEPETDAAAAALGEAAVVASRPGAPASAVALLTGATASPYGPLRVAAWQGLVSVRRAQGDAAGALAAADALAAEGGAAVVQAELARVSLYAEAGDSTAALGALAALEAQAPGSVEVGLARAVLGLAGDDAPAAGRGAAAGTAEVGRAPTAPATDAADVGLALAPNPTGTTADVTLTLAGPADVSVAVYDLLGRAVAMVLSGPLGAGEHRAVVDASALAPGVYVVRATVGEAVRTARLTVAR